MQTGRLFHEHCDYAIETRSMRTTVSEICKEILSHTDKHVTIFEILIHPEPSDEVLLFSPCVLHYGIDYFERKILLRDFILKTSRQYRSGESYQLFWNQLRLQNQIIGLPFSSGKRILSR
jgi:hypothetical protein